MAGESPASPTGRQQSQLAVTALAVLTGGLLLSLSVGRWASIHNRTFDLAFYTRMAWGLAHGELHDPIVGAHFLGLHISPVLLLPGLVGRLLGTAQTLLILQAAAVAAAAYPIARIGRRHLGDIGAVSAALAWLLQPNLGHVVTYEFHPGTLALLPLAWGLDAVDRGDGRVLAWCVAGVLLCREDLGLVTAGMGLVLAWSPGRGRRTGLLIAGVSVAYVLLWAVALHPRYGPEEGSMQLHFGHLGDTVPEAALAILLRPGEVIAHLLEPRRLLYPLKVLAPVALLPLLAPRWLLVALPVVAMNLLSQFPTTTGLDSHYLSPALPALVVAAIVGTKRLSRVLTPAQQVSVLPMAVLVAHALVGGTPLARDHQAGEFTPDAYSDSASRVLDQIPPGASVQAPDGLLAHLAERRVLHRGPPPARGTEFVVVAGEERARWRGREDHEVVAEHGELVLLRRR